MIAQVLVFIAPMKIDHKVIDLGKSHQIHKGMDHKKTEQKYYVA